MRITQQNIVQSNINISKAQLTSNEAKALIGSIIEGRITGIQGQQLATLSTGDKQLSVNINGLNLQENQLVNLKITGFKEGALIAKLVGNTMSSESNNAMSEMLSKLGISEQTENVTILEAMKTANIPISKDNFQMMRQGMSEVKALIAELVSAGQLPLENDLDTPIKALALKIMQQSVSAGTEGKTSVSIQTGGTTASVSAQTLSRVGTTVVEGQLGINENTFDLDAADASNVSKTNMSSVNVTGTDNLLTSANALKATNIASQGAVELAMASDSFELNTIKNNKLDFEQLAKSIQLVFDKEGTTFKESVQALLNQFDYKQESLILKNEHPITLKNIFLAYDALSDEGGITNRFSEVLKGLDTLPISKTSLINIITVLTSEVPQDEKLDSLLEAIRKELPETEIRQGLERELSVIKESTTLNKALNDQMMFMQMPIPINEQIQNVDIYYKKNKKKPNPDDLTLLIALKTYNFGEVRCVVHKQVQTFALNFSFNDETSMTYFESQKEQLMASLATHKGKQFIMTFAVKSSFPEFQSSGESDLESFGFDLKV